MARDATLARWLASADAAPILVWVRCGLEYLWLLTIILVPLAFLRIADTPLPLPSPIETAKIAIFRSLVGLMAALWLIEWGLRGHAPFTGPGVRRLFLVTRWLPAFTAWVGVRSTRWIIVAVWFYLAVTLLGTLLSQSISTSLWGRVPGTDTPSAYNTIAYVVFFGIIATRLDSRAQLWRLLAAIIGVGVLVGLYAILQHFGLGFLRVADPGAVRVSSTLGNPIFAAAVLLVTISLSLTVATVHLVDPLRSAQFWRKAALWSVVVGVQFSGIIFTLSRGPWGGTLAALATFLALVTVFAGRTPAGKALLVTAIAAALAAFVATTPQNLGWFQPDSVAPSQIEQIEERFTSVLPEGTEGGLGQRIGIWRASSNVIAHRPWFAFDEPRLPILSPVVGNGPDFFPVVFMLGSRPVGDGLLPFETTHAHNFLLHHWVELGLLGLLASLFIFIVPILVGIWLIWRNGSNYSRAHKVLLIGLVSALAGRFVEQMVGVAKVSDSLLFWTVLAIMVCLPALMSAQEGRPEQATENTPTGRRGRRAARRETRSTPVVATGVYWRLAAVVLLIGGVLTLTWDKTINNYRALNAVAGVNQAFNAGNLWDSVSMLSRAQEIASDIYQYPLSLGKVYLEYRNTGIPEPECSVNPGESLSYRACLSEKVSDRYAASIEINPWRWRSRLDLADAELALALRLQDNQRAMAAVRMYRETVAIAPHSWKLRNQLARSLITAGEPEASLIETENSLVITGDTRNSAEAMLLRGLAYGDLGQLPQAIDSYSEAIGFDPDYALAYNNRGNLFASLGQNQRAIEDFQEAIRIEPDNSVAYNNLGNAYTRSGEYSLAVESYDQAVKLDAEYAVAYNNRGGAYAQLARHQRAIEDYDAAISIDPQYANAYFNRALSHAKSAMFEQARQDLERAAELGADREYLEDAVNQLEAASLQPNEQ